MYPLDHTTTDTQLAVRACLEHDAKLPPELAVRVVAVSTYFSRLPEGGWPETQEAILRLPETWGGLNEVIARAIAATHAKLVAARESHRTSHYERQVIAAGKQIIDALAVEIRRHGEDWTADSVLAQAYPEMPARDRKILAREAVRVAR